MASSESVPTDMTNVLPAWYSRSGRISCVTPQYLNNQLTGMPSSASRDLSCRLHRQRVCYFTEDRDDKYAEARASLTEKLRPKQASTDRQVMRATL